MMDASLGTEVGPTEVLVRVDGMTCDHCNRALEAAISFVDGAERVSADFTTGEVRAAFAREPDERAIRDAVDDEGYDVLSIERVAR